MGQMDVLKMNGGDDDEIMIRFYKSLVRQISLRVLCYRLQAYSMVTTLFQKSGVLE